MQKGKTERAFLEKKFIKSGGSLENRGKGRGLKTKLPFLFLPSTQNRGGALAHRRRPDSGALGDGGGREEKGKREGTEKVRFPLLPRAGVERRGGATGAQRTKLYID